MKVENNYDGNFHCRTFNLAPQPWMPPQYVWQVPNICTANQPTRGIEPVWNQVFD